MLALFQETTGRNHRETEGAQTTPEHRPRLDYCSQIALTKVVDQVIHFITIIIIRLSEVVEQVIPSYYENQSNRLSVRNIVALSGWLSSPTDSIINSGKAQPVRLVGQPDSSVIIVRTDNVLDYLDSYYRKNGSPVRIFSQPDSVIAVRKDQPVRLWNRLSLLTIKYTVWLTKQSNRLLPFFPALSG